MAVKARLRRRKWVIAGLLIRDELREQREHRSGSIGTASGTTHRGRTLESSLVYIDEVFEDYVRYAAFDETRLRGLRILEIGPGDNLGVALRFRAAGAAQVVALDRFQSFAAPEREHAIYSALARRHGASFDPASIERVHGVGIEAALDVLPRQGFDLIVSRAVLEHVSDVPAAIRAMDALLVPGGRLLHKVDLRDHGMFSDVGLHPLTFLTFPGWLYRRMSSESGRPNRARVDTYRRLLEDLDYHFDLRPTLLLGEDRELVPHPVSLVRGEHYGCTHEGWVELIRPLLAAPFRHLPTEDLITTGIFLIATKRGP